MPYAPPIGHPLPSTGMAQRSYVSTLCPLDPSWAAFLQPCSPERSRPVPTSDRVPSPLSTNRKGERLPTTCRAGTDTAHRLNPLPKYYPATVLSQSRATCILWFFNEVCCFSHSGKMATAFKLSVWDAADCHPDFGRLTLRYHSVRDAVMHCQRYELRLSRSAS